MHVVVADFGLSRDIYESQYYSSSDKQAKLPIKWMAPESIENRLYDAKSDVVSRNKVYMNLDGQTNVDENSGGWVNSYNISIENANLYFCNAYK